MTDKRVWFYHWRRGVGWVPTSPKGRAWAAGNAVVATGPQHRGCARRRGRGPRTCLVVQLDVNQPGGRRGPAVEAAVDRFGRIDVLVNNAANFYGGYFEGTDAPRRSRINSRRGSSAR